MNTNQSSVSNKTINPSPTRPGSSAARRLCFAALVPLLAFGVIVTGCRQPQPAWPDAGNPSPGPTGAVFNPTQVISPAPTAATQLREGDVIQLTFETETNLNTLVKIQLDGTVVLPLVGGVPVTGKSLQAVQTDLRERFGKMIKNPELTVTLASTSASVYVSGAVLRPGRIPLDRPLTAMEAIMEAGGFDLNRAKPSDVSVLRMENGQQKRYGVNLKSALKQGDLQPFLLRPFDIIHVPEKTFNL